MAIELSNLWIAIGAKTSGLATGIADAGRIIGTFAANTKVQIAKINAAWAGFQEVSGMAKLTGGLTLLAAALALSIGPAIKFESAFANVAKTVEGTPQQLGQIRQEILSMADSMPLAATKIAEVAATAGQLGVATSDVTEFTRVMVMLGTATDLTADQAATSMARFTNIMQIPVRELPQLSAALVHLGNNSAATESEILTLGLRLAAAGAQLGLSGEQVLGLSAAMKSLGITAEVGGSSMSRVLIDMTTAAGPKLETFARLVGVTREEFSALVKERSPEAAGRLLLGFVEGLQKVDQSGGSVRLVLQELGLDSIRLRDTIIRLVVGGDQLAESLGLVSSASVYGGALLQEYGRFAETTASRLEILKNRLVGLAIDIGTPMLGGIAAAADAIGDALLRVQGILSPVTAELREFFGNLAEVAGVFVKALAGPAMLAAVGALTALSGVLAAVFNLINAGGPIAAAVIAALVADLLLVRPASVFATSGMAGVSTAFLGTAGAAGVASTALGLLKAALSNANWIGFGVLMLGIGMSLRDAGAAASEAGRALRQDLAGSLESGGWEAYTARIKAARDEIDRLKQIDNGSWSQSLLSVGQMIAKVFGVDVEDSVVNARAKIEEFTDIVNDPNIGQPFQIAVGAIADRLGLTEQAAFDALVATNTLDAAVTGGAKGWQTAVAAVQGYVDGLEVLGAQAGLTGEEIANQGATLEAYSKILGVSIESVLAAAELAGIAQDDLFDNQKMSENIPKLAEYTDIWGRVAAAIGESDDAVRASMATTDLLIAKQKELADAFDEVKQARDAAQFPLAHLAEATKAYAEATAEFKKGNISLEEYAKKLQDLNAAQAAVAPTAAEAKRIQKENADQFRDTALAAKETETAINQVLVEWGLLTTAEIGELQIKGQDTLDLARGKIKELREEVRDEIVAKLAADEGVTPQVFERALARGEVWATSKFEAEMAAATEGVFRDIADLLIQAGVWDETRAEAYLSGNFGDFETAMAVAVGQLETWKGPWVGIMTADNSDVEARESFSRDLLETWANDDYMAILSGDPAPAAAAAETARQTGRNFADDPYEAQFTADNSDALDKASFSRSTGRSFADDTYNAILTADNSHAMARTNDAKKNADEFNAKRPNAVLSATDNASGVIQGAIDRLNRFQSKSITLTATTINQSVGASTSSRFFSSSEFAQGGIVRAYAGGGTENHVAQIARGGWPVRVWAEPETGGEAYIPLAQAKRSRSTAILGTVAREFGYQVVPMAAGGVMRDQASLAAVMAAAGWRSLGSGRFDRTGMVNIHAPIVVNFEGGAGGLDVGDVERVVKRSVDQALSSVNRKLANARR